MEPIFTILLIVVFFAILILGHEAGHFLAAKLLRLEVKEFGLGLPPKIFSRKWRGTEYSINAIPFGGFVKVPAINYATEDSLKTPAWKKVIVFISGGVMNFIIAWVAFIIIFMVGTPRGVFVSAVLDNSPAEIAGLQAGDKLVGIDSITPFIDLVSESAGQPIIFQVERQGVVLNIEAIPQIDDDTHRIGVELIEGGFPQKGFFDSLQHGFQSAWSFLTRIITAFIAIFRYGNFSDAVGPVGIFSAVQVAHNLGIVYFLQLLGVVSLNLMVVNFFPLPALDGGHLLLIIAEKINKKPFSKKIIEHINSVSYILLLILIFIVTIRDIIRLL